MSGKPKHPVTEAEQVRQLTRELHEAIKGCKEAERDARREREAIERARAEHCRFLDESIQLAVDKASSIVTGIAQQCLDQMQESVDEVQAYLTMLLGAGDHTQLTAAIVADASEKLAQMLRPEVTGNQLQLVADASKERMNRKIRRAAQAAGVYVTNDPALVPADTDLVIDARDPGALRFDRPVRFT